MKKLEPRMDTNLHECGFLEKLLDGVEVEWKPLGEVAIKISSGGTPKTGVAEYYYGDIPWLRRQEVDFNDIWETGVTITEAGFEKLTTSGSRGVVALLSKKIRDPVTFQSEMAVSLS